ncbi:hypothetical protein HZH66_012233 [Vespula vulgaris]|uniref:Uncharacterized protein n=1 Tax=Vespula vulgaris TaxID=7454 RepID=A0A834JBZ8_VESVU|nr:hypothetical protein HZH66_012233 [Vespula vulgaris]
MQARVSKKSTSRGLSLLSSTKKEKKSNGKIRDDVDYEEPWDKLGGLLLRFTCCCPISSPLERNTPVKLRLERIPY